LTLPVAFPDQHCAGNRACAARLPLCDGLSNPNIGRFLTIAPSAYVWGRSPEVLNFRKGSGEAWCFDGFVQVRRDAGGNYVDGGWYASPDNREPAGEQLRERLVEFPRLAATSSQVDDEPHAENVVSLDGNGDWQVDYQTARRGRAEGARLAAQDLPDLVRRRLRAALRSVAAHDRARRDGRRKRGEHRARDRRDHDPALRISRSRGRISSRRPAGAPARRTRFRTVRNDASGRYVAIFRRTDCSSRPVARVAFKLS
jgi:hypothetical protein